MALDFIKTNTLKGRRYNEADIPRVSLELKKFLASSKDEQYRALEAERSRLAKETEAKAEELRATGEDLRRGLADNEALRKEIELLKADSAEIEEELDDLRESIEEQKVRSDRIRRRRWCAYSIIGFVIAILVWLGEDTLTSLLIQKIPIIDAWRSFVESFLRIMGAVLLAFPIFVFIRISKLKTEFKIVGFAAAIALTLLLSRFVEDETLSRWSDVIGIATLISTALFIGFRK